MTTFNVSMLNRIKADLQRNKDSQRAKILAGFFKTGKGEYGEGDKFLGITVPEQRKIAKRYSDTAIRDIQKLLSSKIHEHRLTALLILIDKYKKADIAGKKKIFDFYIENTRNIDNWDLVDLSSVYIIGDYLLDKERAVLYKLAGSEELWERRIAIIATFRFIREGQFMDTLKISEMLLNDEHDLIHKAVGWMLREVGKRDQPVEERFLKNHYKKMPRTMLRYAIEKFEEDRRRFYLGKG